MLSVICGGISDPSSKPFDCPRTALTFPFGSQPSCAEHGVERSHIAHRQARQYFLVISEPSHLGRAATS